MVNENFTIGIEEEYMICDPTTGNLVDRANEIMNMIPKHLLSRFSYELLLSEIESNTSISNNVPDAINKLSKNRAILIEIGDKLNYKIGISGTHPTANPKEQTFVNNESYNWVSENLQYYATQNITFALHVHIGFKNNEEPPNCFIAISNDILVLVDGFSKIIIIDLPSKGLSSSGADLFKFFLLDFLDLASSIIFLNSSDVKSDIFMKFFIYKFYTLF